MTKRPAWLCLVLALLISSPASRAQSSVAAGNRLSLASVVAALQGAGFQALVSGSSPATPTALGVISTGINGLKILIVVSRCDNPGSDEVCSLSYIATFNDDKRLINDHSVGILNLRASIGKVLLQTQPDGKPGFILMYTYFCRGFDDSKFAPQVLGAFANEITRVLDAYNTGLGDSPAAGKKP